MIASGVFIAMCIITSDMSSLFSQVSSRISPRSMMTPSSPIKPHHRSALSGRYLPTGNGTDVGAGGPHSPSWASSSSPSDDLLLGRFSSMDGVMTPPADDGACSCIVVRYSVQILKRFVSWSVAGIRTTYNPSVGEGCVYRVS